MPTADKHAPHLPSPRPNPVVPKKPAEKGTRTQIQTLEPWRHSASWGPSPHGPSRLPPALPEDHPRLQVGGGREVVHSPSHQSGPGVSRTDAPSATSHPDTDLDRTRRKPHPDRPRWTPGLAPREEGVGPESQLTDGLLPPAGPCHPPTHPARCQLLSSPPRALSPRPSWWNSAYRKATPNTAT